MHKKFLIFSILYFCTIISFQLSGYNLRQISHNDGLSNSAILSIYQDYEGFMWFGSCDGLNMYNGEKMQVYKPTTHIGSLSGNLIENIIEAEPNVFWIRTNYGLNKFDKDKNEIEYFYDFEGYYFLQKDMNNTIFVLKGDDHLLYYHEKTNSFKNIPLDDIKFQDVLNFVVTSDNLLWIFRKNGEHILYTSQTDSEGNINLIPEITPIHNHKFLYCFDENDFTNTIYFIDDTYTLYEYNLLNKKKYYIYNLKEEIERKGEISSLVKFQDNYFVGFKTNGLICVKYISEISENYHVEKVDINSGIFCLLKDRYQDLLWVGTDGHGVYMYSKDAYAIKSTVLSLFTPQINKPVRSIFLDKKNTLWIGTKGDGILKIYNYDVNKNLTESRLEILTEQNSLLENNEVYSFGESRKNILWIGTDEGINYFSYSDNKIKNLKLTDQYNEPVRYIHSICELNESELWLATVGTGIVKVYLSWSGDTPLVNKIERTLVHEGDFAHNYFFSLYKENDSVLWFGNRGYGAFRMDLITDTYDVHTFDSEYHSQTLNDVFTITKDSNNNFWFGTSFGLIKYNSESTNKIFNEQTGFPNSTIHGQLLDSKNNLWLSTNQGIIRFNVENETFQIYNHPTTLRVMEYSDGAYFYDKEKGLMIFGGVNGITTISETDYISNEYLPPVTFYNLTIFGEEYNLTDFLVEKDEEKMVNLNYSQNFFSISFTALDYINGNNYSYLYKLNHINEQWIETDSRTLSFTNMAPGKYTLYLKYINKITGQESVVYPLILNIRPPWYMSSIAYILYAVLMICSVVFVIWSFIRRNKKKRNRMLRVLQQQHQEEIFESKLGFFTNIAHEFCTPLTLIYGPCNRILSYKGADSFVLENTRLIQRNTERLNDLIQELVEFRRIETGNRTPQIENVNISQLAEEILVSFKDMAESKNIPLVNHVTPYLRWNTDNGFLFTIVSNLLSNAFLYTHEGGEISIHIEQKENNLVIKISNVGKNISEKELELLSDRNHILNTLENHDVNTQNSLGLAIAYNLIKLLDGSVVVNKLSGERTEFVVVLPEKQQQKVITNGVSPHINIRKDYEPVIQELPDYEFDSDKKTILIIDQDIEILWLICETFVEEYNVIPVHEPFDPKRLLNEFQPNIIICDVMIKDMDGIGFAKYVKSNKKTSHISFILISAKQTVEEQIEGLAAGADMYISKPFNIDYLKVSVNHLISRKETLKDYFSSGLSAYELMDGKLIHKESQKFLQTIMEIINNNIHNPELSPRYVASQLNISTRHLYRKMNEIGEEYSVANLIREAKLHVAANLLLNTKMTIDEIIYKSGYINRATFFKSFSTKYNCTPKEYRESKIKNIKS